MRYMFFLPLALFGAIVIVAVLAGIFINLVERRRAVFHARRRPRIRFRPVIIQGGKPNRAPLPAPALDDQKPATARVS